MSNKAIVLIVAILGYVVAAPAVWAGPMVIFVSDGENPAGDAADGKNIDPNILASDSAAVPWDQGFVDALEAAGYEVDYRAGYWNSPLDEDKVEELNEADLIVVSRGSNSGSINEPEVWNGVSAPLLLLAPHSIRQNRWQWVAGGILGNTHAVPLVDTATQSGVQLYREDLPAYRTSHFKITDVGNGEILATVDAAFPAKDPNDPNSTGIDSFAGAVVLARWEADVPFYEGGPTPAGARMALGGVARSATDAVTGYYYGDRYNLTEAGERLFLNAVWQLTQPAPLVVWVSDGETPSGDLDAGRNVDPNLIDPNDLNRPWDQGFVDLLSAQGYDVHYEWLGHDARPWRAPLSEESIEALNEADLVIMSRAAGSGAYREAEVWNAIESPILSLSPHMIRSNRWMWLSHRDLVARAPSPLVDTAAEQGIAIYDVTIPIPLVTLNRGGDAGHGEVLVTVDAEFPALDPNDPLSTGIDGLAGSMVVAKWEAGVPYYDEEESPIPAGPRMIFGGAGARDETTEEGLYYGSGRYNLTLQGEWMLLDAIEAFLE